MLESRAFMMQKTVPLGLIACLKTYNFHLSCHRSHRLMGVGRKLCRSAVSVPFLHFFNIYNIQTQVSLRPASSQVSMQMTMCHGFIVVAEAEEL